MINQNNTQGVFLSLEGVEGAGKSTCIEYIKNYLAEKNIELLLTREPGGTPLAEEIRSLLLADRQEQVNSDVELLLMYAARKQHVETVIKPAIAKGCWVLSDRFADASFAYQGGGRGLSQQRIQQLHQWTLNDFLPDYTILLDLPVETGMARASARAELDRFEQEQLDFFERVRNSYLEMAKQEPKRFFMIDASQTIAEVEQQLKQILDKVLAL